MIKQFGFLILTIVFFSSSSWGQETNKYRGEYANFYRAEELFQKEQYSAAKEVFREFINEFDNRQDPQYVKARYYEGISALELYNDDAVKILMEFNNEYPESIYKNGIYFKLGEHFYQRKKYKDAKEWFKQTDPSSLEESDYVAYHFKLGYSYFQLGDNRSAKSHFYDIKDKNSNYRAPALYYYSYISYKDKSYNEALEGFLKLQQHASFSKEVPYYITQIYYLTGDFEKVTEYIPEYSAKSGNEISEMPAEMLLLAGDAYYRIGDYNNAVPYLEAYNMKKETTREEDYTLGYSYFKNKQYTEAIRIFDRVSRKKDQLGQTSFYHIAQSYMAQEEFNSAIPAFKSASELDFNMQIKEDALYNFAVLSYKLDYDPYNASIRAFELFLTTFPNSERKNDVYSYMVDVYSNTKNYTEALKSIERIPDLNVKLKVAYQIVSFNMGVDKYERSDYTGAIKAFQGVYKYNVSSEITGKAKFWEADSYYMQTKWKDAIRVYREFNMVPGMNDESLKERSQYNIGYAYFNQEDWTQAIQVFRAFVDNHKAKNQNLIADAYARLGDIYFTKTPSDIPRAIQYYQQSLSSNIDNKDKILYSLSKAYRITPNKRSEHIATLNEVISNYPESPYMISAIFDIAISYKNGSDFTNALKYFNRILNNHPNNIIVKDVLIEIGDIRYKQQSYADAESYFKRVLNEYSLDDVTCKRVTKGLIDVYRQQKRQDKIVDLGKEYPCAGITEDDEEIFYYETAVNLYMSKKYDEAIPEINKYLNHYPNGRFSIQLLSYLGEIYNEKGNTVKALEYYEEIISRPNSDYKEDALVFAAKTLYNQKEYDRAYPHYKELEKLAKTPQVVFNSRIGLMRTSFLLENYKEAASTAQKLVDDQLLEEKKLKVEVNYAGGLSNFYLKNYSQAIPFLLWTKDNSGGADHINTLYYLSESYFHQKNYSESEKYHNQIMQKASNDDFMMIGKSLILQAKVYMVQDDLFQAEQTINLVIDNYPGPDEDGILMEAEHVKSEILQLKNEPKFIMEDIDREIDLNEGNDE